LEALTGRPAAQLFDVIVGTSTGGILALGLVVPGQGGGPAYSALDLAELYPLWGKRIFPGGGAPTFKERLLGRGPTFAQSTGNSARRVGSIAGGNPAFGGNARHTAQGLEEALRSYFGEHTLSDALTEVMVTSFDATNGRPFIFSRSEARSHGRNFKMRVVARATSAAPTFLPPQPIRFGEATAPMEMIDGGVWANNPVTIGYHQAIRIASERRLSSDSVIVVSFGTGSAPVEGGAFASNRTWLGSLTGLAGIATDTNIQDFVMAYQLNSATTQRYWRFQTFEAGAAGAMDDPTPERLNILALAARAMVDGNMREIETVAALLLR
jgi:predicted acylesterase/phospholipase RssA